MLNFLAAIHGTGVAASTSSYESIATVTVGSGGASNIEFTSIPSTYKHLQIRGINRFSNADTDTNLSFQLNSDTGSNYAFHRIRGNGSTTYAGGSSSVAYFTAGDTIANNSTANVYCGAIIDILHYADSNKYKTTRMLMGWDANGSGFMNFASGLWQSTSAVTSIKIYSTASYTFSQYSTFALYGIKG